ncbi:hypothetical protein H4R26_000774 [Coemansia thaxteri]|uniref:Uncharacterized protein n=1 Tax=Coemansia thaxteri TaxID=2663907 RepID=A0A9W8EHJ7_9FUNG|nr:hypothetical protein H4R26_000774 [Coemansia thaxteri]KAJ2486992.1 hypothetical protein EV174_000793 [Coemansia sp. RSA 2320]
MEQDAEVSTLMDSLNRLIQQSDEPVAPADSHLQRLEPALQLLDGKLSENGRMLGEALTKINQLTEVLLCQGKLLTQMCARQDASSRDLGVVNAEIKQARLDTAEQLQLIARAQVHFTMQAQANRSSSRGNTAGYSIDIPKDASVSVSPYSAITPTSAQISPVVLQNAVYPTTSSSHSMHSGTYGPVALHSASPVATDVRKAYEMSMALAQQQQQQRHYSQMQQQLQKQQLQQQQLQQQQLQQQQQYYQQMQQRHHSQQYLAQVASAQQNINQTQAQYAFVPAKSVSISSATPEVSTTEPSSDKLEPPVATPIGKEVHVEAHMNMQVRQQPAETATVQPTGIAQMSSNPAVANVQPQTLATAESTIVLPIASGLAHTIAPAPDPVPIVAPASAPAPVVAPVLAPAPASTPAKSAVILIADTPTTPAASKPGSAVKSAMLPLSLIKAVSPTAVVQPSKSQTNDQTAKPLGQPVPAAKSVIAAKPVAAAAAAAAKLVAVAHPTANTPSQTDSAAAAARAAIPTVLATKPVAASKPKRSEPIKLPSNNAALPSKWTLSATSTAAPVARDTLRPSTQEPTAIKSSKSAVSLSSLESGALAESRSPTPRTKGTQALPKPRGNPLLDSKLEPDAASTSNSLSQSRTRVTETRERQPVTRSPSRPRVRSTSRSRARRRRRQSRSRSNPRLYRPRSRSRSSSRSISDSRYVPRPVSRSRNSRDSGDYSADVKLTIKGRTKHQGDDDDDARRPSKYRATSPRVGSAVMFSDEVGSESNSDVDDMIERRIVRSESPDLGSEDRVAVIGIVGASSNKHSPVPHADITSRLGTRLPVYDHCSNSNDDSDHANGDKYSQLISTYSNKHDGLHSTHDEKQMPACLSNQRGSSHGRQELSSWLRDSSGVEITAARLSSVLGPFCYMSLPMISTVYRLCFGCSPMMPGVRLDEYNRALTALEGFRYWPWFKRSSQPGEPLSASIKFIQRDGNEYDRLKERILDRLRITRRGGSVVLGPLLCYYLLMLGCTPTGQLPWPVVDLMFKRVTGLGIASLRVATKDGVQRMSAEDVWIMAKTWVVDLCMFMARGSRMQYSLDMATQCNGVYTDKCRKHGGAHGDDSDGMVAKEMLVQNEEHSQLFLGIRSTELQRLYRYLVCMVGTLVDQSTLKYLKQVSESFLNLSE